MPHPGFEYDGRTDEPHPPLRNSTPLLLAIGLGGALLVVLLIAAGLVALFLTHRSADPATGKVDAATPVSRWDVTVAGERAAERGRVRLPWMAAGDGARLT